MLTVILLPQAKSNSFCRRILLNIDSNARISDFFPPRLLLSVPPEIGLESTTRSPLRIEGKIDS